MYKQIIALSLAACAAAAPVPGLLDLGDLTGSTTEEATSVVTPPITNKAVTATFEDLNPGLGGVISLSEIGPYDGLDYQGISKFTSSYQNTHLNLKTQTRNRSLISQCILQYLSKY